MRIDVTDGFSSTLDEVARRSPGATFYHTSVWIQSLIEVYPKMLCRCIVAEQDGDVTGYLPFFVARSGPIRRLWSLPFGTYGGPVALDGDATLTALTNAYAEMRRDRGVQEVGLVDFANGVQAPTLAMQEAHTHVLGLSDDFDQVWTQRFDKAKRRQTRKAQREGIDVDEARSVEDVKHYYEIYASRSREWRQHVVYPERLFVELFERGGTSVRLFLARGDGKLLGGHLNFYYKDSVIAWNGVTTEDSRGVQASTLLYARCIRHACESGYKSYNLGASLGKTSLIDYKESLGGVRYDYAVGRWRSKGIRAAGALLRLLHLG